MSKTDDSNANYSWSTREELLLAFAVNRHGTKSWDSIAMEIQNRTSSPLLLTAQNCKRKYHHLQRRFMAVDEKTDGGDVESEHEDNRKIPWLDELRKLRVAELRREVQRHDVSIVSLQSKVRKLKEERERCSEETDNDDEKPDLERDEVKNEGDAENKEKFGEDKKSFPEIRKRIPGDRSYRENESFNESNSKDPKDENPKTGMDDVKRNKERFPKSEEEVETASGKPDPAVSGDSPEDKAVGELSYNGRSDTIAKGAVLSLAVKSPAPIGELAECPESVSESKGGEDWVKENSDIQSSASLSRKRHRNQTISGSSSGEEPEPDELSPVSRRISIKSHPLVGFLETIRSHKHGSVFERRLESQDGNDYQRLIRQHIDLEMVRTKLEEGLYSDRSLEFFRDLLLLFNNAIVFFPKNSSESIAAIKLRQIVSMEMARSIPKSCPPSKGSTPPLSSLPKPDSEGKSNSSGPMVVCGKRSSTSAKTQPVVETIEKEKPEINEKPEAAETKEPERSSMNVGAVEPRITKKRTREMSASIARGARTNKTRANSFNGTRASNSLPNFSSNCNSVVKTAVSNENSEVKMEKKSGNAAVVAKKRSAANFLNRMKSSLSSPPNRMLLNTLKNSVNNSSSSSSRGPEQKKGGRGDGRRDLGLRRGSSGKLVEKKSSPAAKRSVGRPPKRASANPQTSSRRTKVETVTKPPPRKRGRR